LSLNPEAEIHLLCNVPQKVLSLQKKISQNKTAEKKTFLLKPKNLFASFRACVCNFSFLPSKQAVLSQF